MKQVLVVDDVPQMRSAIKKIVLEEPGVSVLEVGDGCEAPEVIEKGGVDLVLTDCKMPNKTGIELMEAARERYSELPFIVVSSGIEERDVRHLQPHAVMSKPFDPICLKEAVRTALTCPRPQPLEPRRSSEELASENNRLQRRIEELEGQLVSFLHRKEVRERAESNTHHVLLKKSHDLQYANERLKEHQAQLIHSEKMASLGQLSAGIAHEINNPVGFVMSNLRTLNEYVGTFQQILTEYDGLKVAVEAGDDTAQQESLRRVEEVQKQEDLSYVLEDVDQLLSESDQGMHRVKEIVEGLKSFARLDDAQPKEADLNEGIEETLKVVWNELKYKCQVHKRLGKIPLVRCYPGQLKQVFMNLLVNAVQAIPQRGEVTVETQATEIDIVVRISDTGQGIPEECLSKIFTPFFTTKPVGEGTGLGLSISYGIVQKHGGRIEVESEVGKGTTFTVRVPIEGSALDGTAILIGGKSEPGEMAGAW